MANQDLSTLKVAILVTDGFEQVEMTQPQQALKQAGAETHIVSPKRREPDRSKSPLKSYALLASFLTIQSAYAMEV